MSSLSFNAPEEVKNKLDFFARKLKRSKAFIMREALQEYLEDLQDYTEAVRYEKKRDPRENLSLAAIKRKYKLK